MFRSLGAHIVSIVVLLSAFVAVLFFMGRIPICECGYIKLWHGVTASSENSQHISDWYTFSHIIHGFIFYWLLSIFARKLPVRARLFIALLIEIGWEIFENTDFVINRYREVTISLDYFGDSILNSFSDVVAMVLGFFLAWRLPVLVTIALLVVMEVAAGFFIHDNLTLNVIMLLHPFDAILNWQAGG